jgi:hypothetical protein
MKVNCRRWLCGEAKTQSMKISISKAEKKRKWLHQAMWKISAKSIVSAIVSGMCRESYSEENENGISAGIWNDKLIWNGENNENHES